MVRRGTMNGNSNQKQFVSITNKDVYNLVLSIDSKLDEINKKLVEHEEKIGTMQKIGAWVAGGFGTALISIIVWVFTNNP